MNLGQWLGQWSGDWFGPLEPAPVGSIAGSATIRLDGSATPAAAGWMSGTSTIQVGGTGNLTAESGEPIVVGISGTATITITASGTLNRPEVVASEPAAAAAFLRSEGGTGYIWKDNSWVQADKVAYVTTERPTDGRASTRVQVTGTTTYLALASENPQAQSSARSTAKPKLTLVKHHSPTPNVYAENAAKTTTISITGYNGTCETLGIDEILVALGMAA